MKGVPAQIALVHQQRQIRWCQLVSHRERFHCQPLCVGKWMVSNKLGVLLYGLKRYHVNLGKFSQQAVSVDSDVASNVEHDAVWTNHITRQPVPFLG